MWWNMVALLQYKPLGPQFESCLSFLFLEVLIVKLVANISVINKRL